MHKLVLLRHGESEWNQENRFTGWHDVDLTAKGEEEGRRSGRLLKDEGFVFDVVYTSLLKRGDTHDVAGSGRNWDQTWVPVHREWRLNERHYGALQGLNKAETAAKHGEDQVLIWRRSYDVPPPALDPDDERHPGKDRRYAQPACGESPPFGMPEGHRGSFHALVADTIAPVVQEGKSVLIVAHGNSLRALVKYLDGSVRGRHRGAKHSHGHASSI